MHKSLIRKDEQFVTRIAVNLVILLALPSLGIFRLKKTYIVL